VYIKSAIHKLSIAAGKLTVENITGGQVFIVSGILVKIRIAKTAPIAHRALYSSSKYFQVFHVKTAIAILQ